MMCRRASLMILSLLGACLIPGAARADTEDGGSGLYRVEQAYALPIGRPLFNLGMGYYSMAKDSTQEARYMTLTPSITLGLGMGFEGSLGIPLDGLTTTEGLEDGVRQFNIRASEATAKVRYTANFFTPRVRFGGLVLADLPLTGSRRLGGTKDPDVGYDPGAIGMLSFNFGPYDVPMRLHANGGYWQSRNDGAVYFRDYPGAITVPGLDPDNNDVILGGLAFEAGFRGATLFAELTGEYLADGAEFMSESEGYWRFTPGVKFKLSNTIAMTAAISADMSSDDSATEFNPDDVYPETEFQLGLSLGRVFGQAGYETSKRNEDIEKKREQEELAAAQAAAAAAAASRLAGTPVEASAIRAEMSRDSTKVPAATMTVPTPMLYPPATNESRMMEMENRLRFLELNIKLNELEQRLRWMSPPPAYQGYPAIPDSVLRLLRGENVAEPATETATEAAPASVATADTTARVDRGRSGQPDAKTAALLASQQQEIENLRRDMDRQNQPPAQRQNSNGTTYTGNDDDNTAAAVAAGMVAGAALSSSGNKDSQPTATTTPPGETPAAGAAVAMTAGAAAATTSTQGNALSYPMTAGERSLLVAQKTESSSPQLTDPTTKAALDRLAADLKAHPDAQVLVLVHGAGADAAATLKATEDQAGMIDDYLTLGGCAEAQVQVMGLGNAEPSTSADIPSSRLEVARIR